LGREGGEEGMARGEEDKGRGGEGARRDWLDRVTPK